MKEKENYNTLDFSSLHPNFYGIEKEKMLLLRPLKERLSSGDIDYTKIVDESDFLDKGLRFLVRKGYGLFSFITDETNPTIFFTSLKNESFCDLTKNLIQVSLVVLFEEQLSYQQRIDIVTHIVFHELYHKKFTITSLRKKLNIPTIEKYYSLSKELTSYFETLFITRLHATIHNILEDKREEKLGAIEFPGNVFFFEEGRKYAFYLHYNKKFRTTESIPIEYLLIKILLPELEPRFKIQIKEYVRNLNFLAKAFEDEATKKMPTILKLLEDIDKYIEDNQDLVFSLHYEKILDATVGIASLFPPEIKEELEKILPSFEKSFDYFKEFLGELENLPKYLEKGITREKEIKIEKIISSELKKIENENSFTEKNEEKVIEEINSPDGLKTYNKVEIIQTTDYKFDYSILTAAKKAAKNIINNMGFLNAKYNRNIEEFELLEGEIDETELYSLGFGNKYIFETIEKIPGYEMAIAILLDESGSMSAKIKEAIIATLALLLALKDINNIDLFVYGHTVNISISSRNSNDIIQMFKYYNSVEGFKKWETLFSAKSRANNADGFAIEKIGQILKTSRSKNKLLIVVSDGQPNATNYGGKLAQDHVKRVVDRLENEGILVVQICIDFIKNSPLMFKHFFPYEEDGKFFDNLKSLLLKKFQDYSNLI